MLLEIRCEEFKDKGKIRNPIIFRPGLNTIMGASRASNSIGKTTFLLVIDFVFGGRDYVMLNNDVTKNVGEHSIEFAFQFGDDIYRFSRSTNDLNYVVECDENYQPKPGSRMYIDTYCEFLARQYAMDNLSATFRELVSGYFRIYGRNNYDERHPLRAHGNDTMEAGIRRLLQLYGKYGAIGKLAALYENALEKETTYKNALKHQYIRGVTNATDYETNKKKIDELQERKEKLASDSAEGLLDLDSLQASRLSEIKKKLAGLRRQRGKIRSQIRAMEVDMEIDESSFKRDYGELREFFPDADIKHIEEIDAFHRQLKSVLKSQYKDNQKKLNDAIELLDMQISVLEREVSEINDEPHLTKAVLDDYANLDREMKNLRDDVLDEQYGTDIFTDPTIKGKLGVNAMKAKKHLYDHIVYDSSNERDFATDLDTNTNVAAYVKLPDGFYISTPVGHYNPDWAIAFYEGSVKHIYFVAETKGSMNSMQLRLIEESKIHCAREHFKAISGDNVVYDVVDSYTSLMEKVMK